MTQNHVNRWVLFLFVLVLAVTSLPADWLGAGTAHASGGEDGAIKQHELFEFEAFIKHADVVDGTAPFDSNNQPGNDAAPDNKIVRSFDSVSYPVKVTINPKKVDKLENITLRLSGTLDNGIIGNRVNAKFAVGGYEDLSKNVVGFTQEYTVKQTGNSIMIPVSIEVQGAKPGVKLTPKIKVEVVSVDGEPIKGVVTAFEDLPGVTVSAQVNIKPYVNYGLAGRGIQVYPYAGITKNEDDIENTHAFSVSWGVDRLAGKSDMRGATFPDPDGTINYEIELGGSVAWDAKPNKTGVEAFDFEGRDEPVLLFDHQPINMVQSKIGQTNMVADGKPYNYVYRHNYSAPQSQMPDLKPATIEKESYRMVWDSGEWEVSRPNVGKKAVSYTGTNTDFVIGSTFPKNRSDGYTGSNLYGVNDKVFASRSFLVLLPNQYRIEGPNNPKGYANNANYTAKVVLKDYVDEKGNVTTFNKSGQVSFTERNNPSGAYSLNTTLFSYPGGKQIGTPNVGDGSVSKGDVSTLMGEDVQIVGYLYPKTVSYGGHQAVFRWNTDAFELTERYANIAKSNLFNSVYYTPTFEAVRGNPETQFVYFGVPKFPKSDNRFERFTEKQMGDYEWFTDYKQAIKKGPIGAMRLDVRAATAGRTHSNGRIPLRVKHENIGIGAETKDGSANIILVNYYAYSDKERKRLVDVTGNKSYHNPAIWDETGNMVQKQSPSGSSVNFETLAVLPAESQSVIDSDKTSYYNSETIRWSVKNSVVLPSSGVPDDFDSSVQVTQTLPKGLTYKPGSGHVGDMSAEPEIEKLESGETLLKWDLLVSSNGDVDGIRFDTDINPFALTGGVQSGITIKNVISSDLDQRAENLRTSTKTVTVLKVGMVGIFETIDKLYGGKNSAFTVTLSPYTTIEDELGVTGLTAIPLNADRLGSKYSGSATLKDIRINADRKHDNPVKIYLNKRPVYDNRPQDIDVTKDGWYEYTGQQSQLDGAVSLLFHVDGLMTNTDDIRVEMQIQTKDNDFGDQYLNETVINSATDYKLSPVSNRVRYYIRADLELALERIRIYTDKANKGLPVSVRVKKTVLDEEKVKNSSFKLVLYDGSRKIAEKSYTPSTLLRENELNVPAEWLTKGGKKNYTVKIEGFDDNIVWVKDGEDAIDTDGYASSEKTLTNADADASGKVTFKGVVMTERELGKNIVPYYETLTINKIAQPKVKAGYGFEFVPVVSYTNDLLGEITNKMGIHSHTDADMVVDKRLMDSTMEYYREDADTATVPMERKSDEPGPTSSTVTYQLPLTYLEQGSGKMYSANQKENGAMTGDAVSGGNRLFVPVWVDETGTYDAVFKGREALGSHHTRFSLVNQVEVYAYMFNHADSRTPDTDELLLQPMSQDDESFGWSGE